MVLLLLPLFSTTGCCCCGFILGGRGRALRQEPVREDCLIPSITRGSAGAAGGRRPGARPGGRGARRGRPAWFLGFVPEPTVMSAKKSANQPARCLQQPNSHTNLHFLYSTYPGARRCACRGRRHIARHGAPHRPHRRAGPDGPPSGTSPGGRWRAHRQLLVRDGRLHRLRGQRPEQPLRHRWPLRDVRKPLFAPSLFILRLSQASRA